MEQINETTPPKKKADKIDAAFIRLVEQELKAMNDKLDWIASNVQPQQFNPLQPPVFNQPSIPVQIPNIPPVPMTDADGQPIPSWELKKVSEEKKIEPKKKRSPNFKRLIIIMGGIILLVIFFQYGIPWIKYFYGG
jgi:hypothetical protein